MRDIDTERDRWGTGTEPRIFFDRGLDDDAGRHRLRELVDGVIAGASVYRRKINPLGRREGCKPLQGDRAALDR
jgi:hypothetical protein